MVERAVEIAQEARQTAFAQDLATDRHRTAMRVVGKETAFKKAVEATASRIDGTRKAKPIRDPLGYLWKTFADYLAKGVPADPVYRPKQLTQPHRPSIPNRPVVVIADEERPTSAIIWAWKKRGAPIVRG